jgi:hypothetical protein
MTKNSFRQSLWSVLMFIGILGLLFYGYANK